MRKYRAEAVCIVGKGIWESIYRVRHNGAKVDSKKFSYGWQGDEQNMGQIEKGARLDADGNFVTENATVVEKDGWGGARVYVVPSTSGLVTIPQATQREVWGKLGEWVNKRREERKQSGITAGNQKD